MKRPLAEHFAVETVVRAAAERIIRRAILVLRPAIVQPGPGRFGAVHATVVAYDVIDSVTENSHHTQN